jgi:hypothetical protein
MTAIGTACACMMLAQECRASSSLHDGDGTNGHSNHDQGSGSWHGGTGKSKK